MQAAQPDARHQPDQGGALLEEEPQPNGAPEPPWTPRAAHGSDPDQWNGGGLLGGLRRRHHGRVLAEESSARRSTTGT